MAAVAATGLLPHAPGRAAASASHEVEIKDFAFVPARLHVAPGDKVTFTNVDIVPHTATALDETWSTGSLEQGEQRTVEVTDGMSRKYFCRYHPSMTAELMVKT